MTIKILSQLVLSILVSGLSAAYENTHECISLDGSSILFQNKPSKVPLRMYISKKCIDGKISDHAVSLYVKLRNPSDDGLLFKGTVTFMYNDSYSPHVGRFIDEILNDGVLIGRGDGHNQYRIEQDGLQYIYLIPLHSEGVSYFQCTESFCSYKAIVSEVPMFYRFLGRYDESFDPVVAEQVMKDFVRQVFNL